MAAGIINVDWVLPALPSPLLALLVNSRRDITEQIRRGRLSFSLSLSISLSPSLSEKRERFRNRPGNGRSTEKKKEEKEKENSVLERSLSCQHFAYRVNMPFSCPVHNCPITLFLSPSLCLSPSLSEKRERFRNRPRNGRSAEKKKKDKEKEKETLFWKDLLRVNISRIE